MTPNIQSLSARTAAIQKSLHDAARGPLIAAMLVTEIANDWDSYKEEAGGVSANAWARKAFGPGKGIAFFTLRHDAVVALEGERLGGEARRCLDHLVAVWVFRNVPKDRLQQAKSTLIEAYTKQQPAPLTLSQARPLFRDVIGKQKRHRRCARCAQLEARIRELEGIQAAAE